MNSRIERYQFDEENEIPSRVEKNKSLYNNVDMPDFSRVKLSSNVKVLESSSKTIDVDKIKKYIETNNDVKVPQRSVVERVQIEDKPNTLFEEKRVYDINSVLEQAKEKRETYYEDEKYKKLRDTQYDILSKVKVYDEEKSEDDLKFNTDEKELIDLINTIAISKNSDKEVEKVSETEKAEETNSLTEIKLFKEEEPKKEEKNTNTITNVGIKNLDKTFYTNSTSFSKEDFEGFEELEKTVIKNNKLVKIVAVVLVLLFLITIFVVLKFVLKIF